MVASENVPNSIVVLNGSSNSTFPISFYSINESDVYMVFKNAGYRPLIAFELSRLCDNVYVYHNIYNL